MQMSPDNLLVGCLEDGIIFISLPKW